jgi:hypothetical protein
MILFSVGFFAHAALAENIGGRWISLYHDEALGLVDGKVTVVEDEGRVSIVYRARAGGDAVTVRGSIAESDGDYVITLDGPGPSAADHRVIPLGDALSAGPGDTVIPRAAGAEQAELKLGTAAEAAAGVTLRLSPDGGALAGTWHQPVDAVTRRNREGGGRISDTLILLYDEMGGAEFSGREAWRRPDPEVLVSLATEDQFGATLDGPDFPHPFKPTAAAGRAGSETRTLLVIGWELPPDRLTPIRIRSDDPAIEYEIYAFPDDLRDPVPPRFAPWLNDGLARLGEWLPQEAIAALQERDLLLVRANLRPGIEPGEKTFEIDGAEAVWHLQFGDRSGEISLSRSIGKGQTEPAQFLYSGETVFAEIMLDYDATQTEIPLMLGAIGSDGRTRFIKTGDELVLDARQDPEEPRRFVSAPLELTKPEYVKTFRPGQNPVGVLPGENLVLIPAQRPVFNLRPDLAKAAVLHGPPDLRPALSGSPRRDRRTWADYVNHAGACHDHPPGPVGQLVELDAARFSNYIVFAGRRLDTDLKVGEHAAAILLRDIFADLLNAQVTALSMPLEGRALDGFRNLVADEITRERRALGFLKVAGPEGGDILFASTFAKGFGTDHSLFGKALADYLRGATGEARRHYARLVERSMQIVEGYDACDDVDDLLLLAGQRDFLPVVQLAKHLAVRQLDYFPLPGNAAFSRPVVQPDRNARAWIDRIRLVASTLEAQQQAASEDTDAILVGVSLAALPLGLIEAPMALIAMTVIEAFDIAAMTTLAIDDRLDVSAETELALGASTVIGASRLSLAEARRYDWFSDTLGIFAAAGLTAAFSDIDVAYRIVADTSARRAALSNGRAIARRTSVDTLEALSREEGRDLLEAILDARWREMRLGRSVLAEDEVAVLRLSDEISEVAHVPQSAGRPDWARSLSDAAYGRLGAFREMPHVIRLIGDYPDEMAELLENPDVLPLLMLPRDLPDLQRAVTRMENSKKPPVGPHFYEQSGHLQHPNGTYFRTDEVGNTISGGLVARLQLDSAATGRQIAHVTRSYTTRTLSGSGGRTLELWSAKIEAAAANYRWIDELPFPLTDQGVPLGMFLNHRAMNAMGISYGDFLLTDVKLSNVVSVNTCVELHWMKRMYPDTPLEELVQHTHSYRYTENFLRQAGFKIDGVQQIAPGPGGFGPSKVSHIERFFNEYYDGADLPGFLARHGLNPDDEVQLGYDIYLKLSPLDP